MWNIIVITLPTYLPTLEMLGWVGRWRWVGMEVGVHVGMGSLLTRVRGSREGRVTYLPTYLPTPTYLLYTLVVGCRGGDG